MELYDFANLKPDMKRHIMRLADLTYSKLIGYNIREENESLRNSLEDIQSNISLLSQRNEELQRNVAAKEREICQLSNGIQKRTNENTELRASLNAKQVDFDKLVDTLHKIHQRIEDLSKKEENLKISLENSQKSVDSLSQENDALRKSDECNKQKIYRLSSVIDEKTNENEKLSASLSTKNVENKQLSESLEKKELETKVLSGKEADLRVSLESAQSSIASLSQRNDELQKNIDANKQEIDCLSERIEEKVNENELLSALVNTKQAELEQLTDELGNKEHEIKALSEKEVDMRTSLERAQSSIVSLSQRNDELQKTNDANKQEIDHLSEGIKEKVCENEKLSASVNTKQIELEQLVESLRKKEHDNTILSAEREELSVKIRDAENKRKSLEEAIANLENQVAYLKSELETQVPASDSEDVRELENQIQKNEEDIQKLNRQIEILNEGKERDKINFEDVCQELKKTRAEKDALSEQVSTLKRENEILHDSCNKLKKDYSDLQQTITHFDETEGEALPQNGYDPEVQTLNTGNENADINNGRTQDDSVASGKIEDGNIPANEMAKEIASGPCGGGNDPEEQNSNVLEEDVITDVNTQEEPVGSEIKVDEDSSTNKKAKEIASESCDSGNDTEEHISNVSGEDVKAAKADSQGESVGSEIEGGENKPAKRKGHRTKAEKTIELCGDSIKDFPPVVTDDKHTQRTIEYVFDENNQKVYADDFFGRSPEEISGVCRKMSESEIKGEKYWTCGMCRERVKIGHRTYNDIESLFFIHADRTQKCDCPWLQKSTGPNSIQDIDIINVDPISDGIDTWSRNRMLKEKIFSLLSSKASKDIGVSEVKLDEVIASKVPYLKWRKPDISFIYKGKKVVFVLQKKSHNIDTIVDRDRFFRLNGIQILWIFGSDSDSSYEYMCKLNYRSTMFDNHRNVFVFDKEAQTASEENGMLLLKCNWLDDDDSWHFRIENSGTNGIMVNLNDLIFDDEYCKPYYYDANKEYFAKNPTEQESYLSNKQTKEEAKRTVEEEWINSDNYEDAKRKMHRLKENAKLNCIKDLWGFKYDKTIIIPPIFTVKPKSLQNGYWLVQQGCNLGIVDCYGEKVVSWDGLIPCEDMNYDSSNNFVHFKRNGLWGVADALGKEMISPSYQAVVLWTNDIYRVQRNDKWGLRNIKNELICDCIYDKIENITDNRACTIKSHPTKVWKTVTGYIDINGKELYSSKTKQGDGLFIVGSFELWGLIDENDSVVIPCQYEEVVHWSDYLYKVKENDKWGIYNVKEQKFLLNVKYDSISDIQDGIAKMVFANVETSIDVTGQEVAQEVVQLQNGIKKIKMAGKWGIVNAVGDIMVNYQYDEIGSFRSRMIGVINGKLIKLDANYEYPIHIAGEYISSTDKCHFFNVAGVKCMMAVASLRQAKQTISGLCDSKNVCNQLAFLNLLFNKKQYSLRFLDSNKKEKKLSHGDCKNDFPIGKVLSATIISFKYKKSFKIGEKRKIKAMVRFSNGKKSMVPQRFFNSAYPIDKYDIGDIVLLEKIGFDDELDQTIWEVKWQGFKFRKVTQSLTR